MELKQTFGQAAEQYHAFRPHYPAALFEELVTATALRPDARLLEIGPGTGQATLPLAKRGYQITAVELSPAMAQKAQAELADYPNVEVITGAFEKVALPEHQFNLVYSATALHWVEPAVKFTKPHRLLKNGGHLAVIHTHHVSDEAGDRFFVASQPIFLHYVHSDHPMNRSKGFTLKKFSEIGPGEPVDEALFEVTSFTKYPMEKRYNSDEYVGLIGTYSPHLALEPAVRAQFLAEVKALIDREFGGQMVEHYAMSLLLARRKP